jgi:hypothetical protein
MRIETIIDYLKTELAQSQAFMRQTFDQIRKILEN